MKFRSIILVTAFSALGGVCHAQTADGAGEDRLVVVVQQDPGFDARLVLARELLDISVGPNFAKEFERVISDQISKSGSEGGEEMAWLRTNMPPMLSRMVVRLIDEMAPSYARIFTEEELRGQIAFYRSPLGQAVAAKTLTLGVALQEAQTRVMVEFLGELETKYCARFGCGEGQAAAKPGRHSPG